MNAELCTKCGQPTFVATATGIKGDIYSPREREIVELVKVGLSNREISERLFITETTVKAHLTNAFKKAGVKSRARLVAFENNRKLS